MVCENTTLETVKQYDIVGSVAASYAFMSLLLLFGICVSFYRFAYLNHNWKQRLVVIFYTLAIITALFRILSFSFYAEIDFDKNAEHIFNKLANSSDVIASISTLNIGIYQCVSMVELALRIRGSVAFLEFIEKGDRESAISGSELKQEKQIVWLWVCSIFSSVLSVGLGLYLVSLFIFYYNHDYTPTQHQAELVDYRNKQGWIYGFLYVFLSIYCIAGYAFLYKTM
jgi:hypothetical protein